MFGLLRLRIVDNEAIIREIHVYGQALKLGEKSKIASQHQGLGKWLIEEAEKIVRDEKINKLKIISGVGVREYYKKLGYKKGICPNAEKFYERVISLHCYTELSSRELKKITQNIVKYEKFHNTNGRK